MCPSSQWYHALSYTLSVFNLGLYPVFIFPHAFLVFHNYAGSPPPITRFFFSTIIILQKIERQAEMRLFY